MNIRLAFYLFAAWGAAFLEAWAKPAAAGENTLAVAEVACTQGLSNSIQKEPRQALALERFAGALQSRLIDALSQTRRFKVLARSDLKPVLTEQGFVQSGNVSPEAQVKAFALEGAKYVLVFTLDDFQDVQEQGKFEAVGAKINRRILRAGGVCKIYDTSSGALISSSENAGEVFLSEGVFAQVEKPASQTDKLFAELAQKIARAAAQQALNVYPARVLACEMNQVTINRGKNDGVAPGKTWVIYALGEALVDPDTGADLGRNEIEIGRVVIERAAPAFSVGKILEDNGIEKLQIARPLENN